MMSEVSEKMVETKEKEKWRRCRAGREGREAGEWKVRAVIQ